MRDETPILAAAVGRRPPVNASAVVVDDVEDRCHVVTGLSVNRCAQILVVRDLMA